MENLNGNNFVLDNNSSVHASSIVIQSGSRITVPAGSSINGLTNIIFGEGVLHLEEGDSLSNCTMEVVGDQLQITPLGELAE